MKYGNKRGVRGGDTVWTKMKTAIWWATAEWEWVCRPFGSFWYFSIMKSTELQSTRRNDHHDAKRSRRKDPRVTRAKTSSLISLPRDGARLWWYRDRPICGQGVVRPSAQGRLYSTQVFGKKISWSNYRRVTPRTLEMCIPASTQDPPLESEVNSL